MTLKFFWRPETWGEWAVGAGIAIAMVLGLVWLTPDRATFFVALGTVVLTSSFTAMVRRRLLAGQVKRQKGQEDA